jgi:glyoxylase-like metal-dependent hydrolase (beta-lactamase superfamily II)
VRGLIARIRNLTDKLVRTLIFTHWHGDHTQNALYVKHSAIP